MLVETARLWADLGFYADDGAFHIHGVTGPDEYTTVVDDNTYTNLMARLNLRFAAEAVRRLAGRAARGARRARARSSSLRRRARSTPGSAPPPRCTSRSTSAAASTRRTRGFLDREVWDLERTPAEQFPLLLHYHPLVIYRHQVIKQADIVLAMFLLGDEFSDEQKRANFDYYDRADDRRLLAVGLRPEHRRGRGGRRGARAARTSASPC